MKTKIKYKKVLLGLVFFIISSTIASASTTFIVVKFKPQTINIPVGQKKATLADIDESKMQLKKYFDGLSNDIEFEKLIPKAKPADTLYVNEKGEIKKLNDWSRVFKVKIPNSKRNMMDIIDDLSKFESVEYAQPPVQIKFDHTPDDLHKEGNQWYLTKINAEDAWDITIGSSSIKIALIEKGVASHTDINNVNDQLKFSGKPAFDVACPELDEGLRLKSNIIHGERLSAQRGESNLKWLRFIGNSVLTGHSY